MIRYNCTRNKLKDLIEAEVPGWLERANKRTKKFIEQKYYEESSSIWGKVKKVYVKLQRNKCIFCERLFYNPNDPFTGKAKSIDIDLEHFRPKSSVKEWPSKNMQLRYDFFLGDKSEKGYYWLAYDVENYAASCKVCNSPFKSNYFPVLNKRGRSKNSPKTLLKNESAFLCYPIGKFDEDPAKLITFSGLIAEPVYKKGFKAKRGRVIIDFFRLNNELLQLERAFYIGLVGGALLELENGIAQNENTEILDVLLSKAGPHSSCSSVFARKWESDRTTAIETYKLSKQWIAQRLKY